MIRNLFVDVVIVLALCAVVWGSAPVSVAQEDELKPPYYEEGNLPEGVILTSNANACCIHFGSSTPCNQKNDPKTGLCNETPSCNSYAQWWGCKCGSLALMKSPGPPKKYFVSCGCGG